MALPWAGDIALLQGLNLLSHSTPMTLPWAGDIAPIRGSNLRVTAVSKALLRDCLVCAIVATEMEKPVALRRALPWDFGLALPFGLVTEP